MHRFFVQEGAVLEILGGSPQVFAQSGSSVIVSRGTPRIEYADPDIVESEGVRGVSVSHLCDVVFMTDDTTSCLYEAPIILDTVELVPAIDTLASMAVLMSDSSNLTTKKRIGSNKNGVMESLLIERVKIPNTVIILHQDTVVEAMKRPLLFTRGDSKVRGDRNRLYVQESTVLTLIGQMNTVYLHKGSSIHIDGSQENTIYFERGALVTIEGEGRSFRLIECRSIDFE